MKTLEKEVVQNLILNLTKELLEQRAERKSG